MTAVYSVFVTAAIVYGSEIGFGLTSGLWDVVHDTRIPADVRAALYGPILGQPAARRPPS